MHSRLALVVGCAVACAGPPASERHETHNLRDVTADGQPDSLSLKAVGPHIDSLVVSLEIWSRGERILRDTWPSVMYFRYPPPGGLRAWTLEEKNQEVEQRWAAFFDDDAFRPASRVETAPPGGIEPEGAPGYIAFELGLQPDSTRVLRIWSDIRTADPLTFTYFRGSEDTRTIAWSPMEHRFFTIYACC